MFKELTCIPQNFQKAKKNIIIPKSFNNHKITLLQNQTKIERIKCNWIYI